ncbi:MAG: TetR/AcrR family transcriptional regulator [Candidatus Hydrogenedentes bacterium]|nr:TetR/AcrR family transcriptional regulator [Candidatus Hydrogenedentota bacterium]
MSEIKSRLSVRERVLATASELFYRQGYRATGINQIIAESGVAKASFYDHFPSKEDLLYAYACATSDFEMNDVRTSVMALPTPRERFFGPLNILTPWFETSDYRGCPFQNLMAEAPPEAVSVREVGRAHREKARHFFRELIRDLLIAEPELGPLDESALADIYVVLFEGAMATAVAYRDPWPVRRAIEALEGLLALNRG